MEVVGASVLACWQLVATKLRTKTKTKQTKQIIIITKSPGTEIQRRGRLWSLEAEKGEDESPVENISTRFAALQTSRGRRKAGIDKLARLRQFKEKYIVSKH